MSDNLIDQLRRQAFGWCQQMCNEAADEIERLKAIVDAIPGDDKLATVQWAVKIAAETINCRTTDEPAALTRFYDAWSSLSPSVRAALRGEA